MIGVFDSGYGGLTMIKPFLKELPQYDYLYLGDNARAPYGSRGQESLQRYSEQAVEYLFDQGAQMIIVACNTVSALALKHLQKKYPDKKILGVIKPMVEAAVAATKNKRVSIVGTRGTIDSKAYEFEMKKIDNDMKVYSQACPLLVPFIEEHWQHRPEAIKILKKYLRPIKSFNCDTLILACTHYPLMLKHFKRIMGRSVNVLDSGDIVAASLADYLIRHPEIEKLISQNGKRIYFTSDSPERFKEFANTELKLNIKEVKTAKLWA